MQYFNDEGEKLSKPSSPYVNNVEFFCDVLNKSLMQRLISLRPASPGKVSVSRFLHLWIMTLSAVRWSSKALEMAF